MALETNKERTKNDVTHYRLYFGFAINDISCFDRYNFFILTWTLCKNAIYARLYAVGVLAILLGALMVSGNVKFLLYPKFHTSLGNIIKESTKNESNCIVEMFEKGLLNQVFEANTLEMFYQ